VGYVASNRRILGPDGKVQYTRWTATRDPKIQALPVGSNPLDNLTTAEVLEGDSPRYRTLWYEIATN